VKSPEFLRELQRRHVYKVGAAYAVAGWLVVQIVTQVFPIFEVSALAQRIIVLVMSPGFPRYPHFNMASSTSPRRASCEPATYQRLAKAAPCTARG